MSPFEFVFSLFGLLLGFALIEIISGLVRTVKDKSKKIGLLTPLLGTYAMLQVTSFWHDVWQLRDKIVVTQYVLYISVLLAAIYFFSSSFIFPSQEYETDDLDLYYFENKRKVIPGIFFCKYVVTILWADYLNDAYEKMHAAQLLGAAVGFLVSLALVIFIIISRSYKANLLILIALNSIIFGCITAGRHRISEFAN